MTHVSKNKLPRQTEKLFGDALNSVLKNLSSDEVGSVTSTLLTRTEREMIVKRLFIIYMLREGYGTNEIVEATNTTAQTVVRIRLQLHEVPSKDTEFIIKRLEGWKNMGMLKSATNDTLNVEVKKTTLRAVS